MKVKVRNLFVDVRKVAVGILCMLLVGFVAVSCNKVGKVCKCSNPLEELAWLKAMTGYENTRISKAVFKDKKQNKRIEGFIYAPVTPWGGGITAAYYDCSGKGLCSIGCFSSCENYEVIKEEVIYEKP